MFSDDRWACFHRDAIHFSSEIILPELISRGIQRQISRFFSWPRGTTLLYPFVLYLYVIILISSVLVLLLVVILVIH